MGSLGSSSHLRPFVRPAANFTSSQRLEGSIHSLPELIDFNAQNNATHPFCVQAKPTGELDTLTHGDFKIAVANCARWLHQNLPLADTSGPNALTKKAPVALFMGSDFGLVVHEFALLSLGVPPLVLSPRLPPVAVMHLLQATSASAFIVSQPLSVPAKPALAALEAKGVATRVALPYVKFLEPGIDAASKDAFVPPQNLDDTILLLHSSGTTGLPKPIPLTHRQLLFAVECHKFDTEEEAQGLNVSSLPLFHGFGLVAPGLSMSAGKTTVYPAGLPNAASIIELVKKTKARSMMTVPFLLDDVVNLPEDEGINVLAGLDFVGTGGAALGAGVGDRLVKGGVKLLNFYGTTESGPLSLTFVPKDDYDWKYFRLRTDMKYEVKELDPVDGQRRFRLTTFPYGGFEGIEIADQLIRNEQYPQTDFAAVGRDDDVIVLATGEKANPTVLETVLSEAPMVKSAVAFGENQFNLGVIVEPAQPIPEGQEQAFKDLIWPIITAAGQKMDAFSRIPSQEAIILVVPGVVIPRTDKGSIARKEVYALFEKEIKEVYNKLASALGEESVEALDLNNLEQNLKDLVQKHWKLQIDPSQWSVEASLFDLGLDSLQALQLRRILIAAVTKTEALKDANVSKVIPPEFIYLNPSVQEMSAALRSRTSNNAAGDLTSEQEVYKFVEEYSLTESSPEEKAPSVAQDAVVVLTGSSGSLGSHTLAKLAQTSEVKQIICLIRKSKATSQEASVGPIQFDRKHLTSRGISLAEDQWAKIFAVNVDPTQDRLGLDEFTHSVLQDKITHVVHAAWPMNYLMRLPSFQYQFKFLQSLLRLAAQGNSATKRRFVFISSIAAVAKIGLANAGSAIPETPVDPASAACGIGYADGKLVCEKILEWAAKSHANLLEIVSVRCGQITGARATGAWNSGEQIPMLLRTAQTIGSLPELPGTLSWIPVDDAATVVSEIAFYNGNPAPVQHLENPVRQDWSGMFDYIRQQLSLKEPIPFEDWLEKVANAEEGEGLPVQKLYNFFKDSFRPVACGQVILGTDQARVYSKTLRNMEALDELTVSKYLGYWKETGYLQK